MKNKDELLVSEHTYLSSYIPVYPKFSSSASVNVAIFFQDVEFAIENCFPRLSGQFAPYFAGHPAATTTQVSYPDVLTKTLEG